MSDQKGMTEDIYDKKECYIYTVRNKWITSIARSIDDFITIYQNLSKRMSEWNNLGIQLDPYSGIEEDYATFFTDNKDVAIKAGFIYYNTEENKFLLTNSGKEVYI